MQAQYIEQYGPGYHVPNVFIQYWSMRVMGYLAVLVFLISVGALAHTSQETRDVPGVPVGGGMGWTGFLHP
ncbi:hypothetical protein [Trebonia sp.]|uniref:hypothetical protein n=1 Tax=Trebonia sp. TaxID=2767075 RepID=UPI003BAE324B